MTKQYSRSYYRLLTYGFWSMSASALILIFQGELLLMFGAIIMALVCYDERKKLPIDSDEAV